MLVYVEQANAAASYLCINVSFADTVKSIKEKILDQKGISPAQQRLFFAGKELQDAQTMADVNIKKESTLHLLLRLCGGWLL